MLVDIISKELGFARERVRNVVDLLDGGATVPFIARYRKEATGSMDEVAIGNVKELHEKLKQIVQRKATIVATIEEQGRLTEELKRRIDACFDAVELEDIYLPYKPKRRTRATVARERGLEPLADFIWQQQAGDVEGRARMFVNEDVPAVEDAIAGACDIIAERVSEDEWARGAMRRFYARRGKLVSRVVKGKEPDGVKYADYYEWEEPVGRISSHRLLAIMRGEEEGFLRVGIDVDADEACEQLFRRFVRRGSPVRSIMEGAIADGFKRLLSPSIENETRAAAKVKADDEAIAVFADNLRQLLLSSPLGQKAVLAIDPGFRTGCKVVALDKQGNLLCHSVIYPHPPHNDREGAANMLSSVRTLAQAKEKGQDLVTLCSACHHVLKRVNDDMQNVEDIRTRANNYMKLETPYGGETKVLHFLEVIRDQIGFDELKKKVVNPLTGKKIGAYYGCLLLRPGNIMAFDDPENPKMLEDFIRALGAEPVVYPYRNECCGGYISLKEPDMAKSMCQTICESADSFGAQMLITACPLCRYNLNKSQAGLPVYYFTELLAEALGVKEEALK